MEVKEKYKPLSEEELEKVLDGVYCYGTITGDGDGKFYPAFYSRYTGHAKTLIAEENRFDSREDATYFAKGYSKGLILGLELENRLRDVLKNC
jgi:hypothetical protein